MSPVSVPNAITILGYGASLLWLGGGPWWLAMIGLVADEADGRVARYMGQASDLGSNLDWAVDLTLTGLTAERAKLPLLALVPITAAQAALRTDAWRPPVGSVRAVLTLYTLLKESEQTKRKSIR
jgi:phosphatidylglycerophosphate synthase